jgi:hypothetical protein
MAVATTSAARRWFRRGTASLRAPCPRWTA